MSGYKNDDFIVRMLLQQTVNLGDDVADQLSGVLHLLQPEHHQRPGEGAQCNPVNTINNGGKFKLTISLQISLAGRVREHGHGQDVSLGHISGYAQLFTEPVQLSLPFRLLLGRFEGGWLEPVVSEWVGCW